MKHYQISVNETQLRVLCRACDTYARLRAGQFHHVSDLLSSNQNYRLVDAMCRALEEEHPHSRKGIFHKEMPGDVKIAYDLWTAMEHRDASGVPLPASTQLYPEVCLVSEEDDNGHTD